MKSKIEVTALLNRKRLELNRKSQDPVFLNGVEDSDAQLGFLREEITLVENILKNFDVYKSIFG